MRNSRRTIRIRKFCFFSANQNSIESNRTQSFTFQNCSQVKNISIDEIVQKCPDEEKEQGILKRKLVLLGGSNRHIQNFRQFRPLRFSLKRRKSKICKLNTILQEKISDDCFEGNQVWRWTQRKHTFWKFLPVNFFASKATQNMSIK